MNDEINEVQKARIRESLATNTTWRSQAICTFILRNQEVAKHLDLLLEMKQCDHLTPQNKEALTHLQTRIEKDFEYLFGVKLP